MQWWREFTVWVGRGQGQGEGEGEGEGPRELACADEWIGGGGGWKVGNLQTNDN